MGSGYKPHTHCRVIFVDLVSMKKYLLLILPILLWISCEDNKDENPLYGLSEFDQLYTISGYDTLIFRYR